MLDGLWGEPLSPSAVFPQVTHWFPKLELSGIIPLASCQRPALGDYTFVHVSPGKSTQRTTAYFQQTHSAWFWAIISPERLSFLHRLQAQCILGVGVVPSQGRLLESPSKVKDLVPRALVSYASWAPAPQGCSTT